MRQTPLHPSVARKKASTPMEEGGMRRIEITRAGETSIADQLSEMHAWLRSERILPLQLEPLHILHGAASFHASFATSEDAERFRQRFDEAVHTRERVAE